jgi:hypothetical protein
MCEKMAGKVSVNNISCSNSSNGTCPSCRSKVTKVTDDFRANSLLDVYLLINPSKARSSEEIEELNAEYKRGDPVSSSTPMKSDRARLPSVTSLTPMTQSTLTSLMMMNQHTINHVLPASPIIPTVSYVLFPSQQHQGNKSLDVFLSSDT